MVHNSVIASADTYAEAQVTVDHLLSYGMTRDSLCIVGTDLRLAERPPAVSTARLARNGATLGGGVGLLAAVFVTLVAETSMTGLAVVLWGVLYGVLIGALAGFFRGLVRNRPESVTTEVVPTRYEVRCPLDELSVAAALLPSQPSVETPPVRRAEPDDDQRHGLTDAA
ncbi:general stress protein [Kribbella flavida]|uniref:general stress protein n=1 Tax=Kribbella flavida TaxID=182640 RepID=UPI00019BDB3A|nr:general stress protein [Kribbella flavida]